MEGLIQLGFGVPLAMDALFRSGSPVPFQMERGSGSGFGVPFAMEPAFRTARTDPFAMEADLRTRRAIHLRWKTVCGRSGRSIGDGWAFACAKAQVDSEHLASLS